MDKNFSGHLKDKLNDKLNAPEVEEDFPEKPKTSEESFQKLLGEIEKQENIQRWMYIPTIAMVGINVMYEIAKFGEPTLDIGVWNYIRFGISAGIVASSFINSRHVAVLNLEKNRIEKWWKESPFKRKNKLEEDKEGDQEASHAATDALRKSQREEQ